MNTLFPISEYWYIYVGFLSLITAILSFDLLVLNREAKDPTLKNAAGWVGFWVILALTINYVFYQFASHELSVRGLINAPVEASRLGLEFLTGYIIELALSVDNLFVFIVLFSYFGIGPSYRHRILFYGIAGALLFRGLFIGVGSFVVSFEFVMIALGAFLVFTGAKLFFGDEGEFDPSGNIVLNFLIKTGRILPGHHSWCSPAEVEKKFIIKKFNRYHFTPAFVCLLVIEMTDIAFAMDSIPAVFAITKEPMVVFGSNICAILGLRAMYFLLAAAIQFFQHLKYGLAIVLIFIGAKMCLLHPFLHIDIDTTISLSIVLGVLAVFMGISVPIEYYKQKTQ